MQHPTRKRSIYGSVGISLAPCAGYLSDPPGVMGVETTTLEFPIGQRYSSRLSFDVSGAVLVQNSHNTIETVDSLDIFTPIYGSE